MAMSLAEIRYLINRLSGLARRSLASLRTRGWRATWQRIRVHAQRASPPAHATVPAASAGFRPFTVPFSESPEVSIVIPVCNHVAHRGLPAALAPRRPPRARSW